MHIQDHTFHLPILSNCYFFRGFCFRFPFLKVEELRKLIGQYNRSGYASWALDLLGGVNSSHITDEETEVRCGASSAKGSTSLSEGSEGWTNDR